ncbi:MAG: hypothetical protein AUK53_11855 [Betaproteobacteria bacterium CG2_30_59_46]|nr:MAG: hypothetical protein AUK53_11855 [Betaproteobacteria bacterium CG2_30_59_46]
MISDQQLDIANELADAACALDWNKRYLPDRLRIESESLVRDMHKLAQAIGDDRFDNAINTN